MEQVLLLVHRIPYPPNKGDKIRSYHLLKHIAQRYRVHLGTFVDDPNDWQYVETVKRLCGETCIASLDPRLARVRSLAAFFHDEPLSLRYYAHAGLRTWVEKLLETHPVERILVFSSVMAQYVTQFATKTRVIDFVDIDSDKWRQYADNKSWPMNWVYRREARQLLAYERHIASAFDASLFVSQAEADLFRKLAPESASKIGYFNNGVDTDYFSPAHALLSPYEGNHKVMVFTGAMDYWPNVDAVQWFAQKVLPLVRTHHPDALFYIVGTRPSAQVQDLAKLPGVHVTGAVPDVRPYIAHAAVAVAPLRIARGIQNKVLEAMAMAKTVVVSPQALEGIDAEADKELLLANDPDQFATTVCTALDHKTEDIGAAARQCVVSRYGWSSHLGRVDALLDGASQSASSHQYGMALTPRQTVSLP